MKSTVNIKNRKALYNYEVIKKYVGGIVLTGTEVKSICNGNANMNESFCYFNGIELYIKNMHISKISQCEFQNHDELRERKILLTKKELIALRNDVNQKGLTIIPLRLYSNETHLLKVELALCKGKKDYDKRDSIKERDTNRDLDRIIKTYKK